MRSQGRPPHELRLSTRRRHFGQGARLLGLASVLLSIVLLSCQPDLDISGDAREALKQGWESLAVQEYSQSAAYFEAAYAKSERGTRGCALALYGLGCSTQFKAVGRNSDDAKAYYSRAIAEDGNGDVAPWAALALARVDVIARLSRDIDEGALTGAELRGGYREVIAKYPGSVAAQEAALHLASSLFASDRGAEAGEGDALLQALTTEYPESPYRSAAFRLLAIHAYREGRYSDQYNYLVKQIETLIDPECYRADLYYNVAYQAETRLKHPDLAIIWYERLIQEYPDEVRRYQAQQAVERLKRQSLASIDAAPAAFGEAAR